jgi:glutamine---fructose-6-phosphate transaminase (isomerizing)
MCGIMGHLGPQNSVELVLQGLKRLEYRGYDSAGVSFIDEHGQLIVYKKSGKLENLQNSLKGESFTARSCIGHTRWATHGEVNDTNSHPHNNEIISIVHNGIIENASELKKELQSRGAIFKSQTDSEVFLVLLTELFKQSGNFKSSVIETFKRVRGHSAFVILNSQTAEIFAIRRGAPLVCGIHDVSSEVFVSSDPYALSGYVNSLYFPEDEVLCHLSAANKNLLNFYELDESPSRRYLTKKQDMNLDISDKGDFEHFMLKEIHEQPELVRSLTQFYFGGEGQDALLRCSACSPNKIYLSACGTAAYAGLVIRDYFEMINRISCHLELASEFRYRDPIIDENDLAVFISQSGETADTLAAQALCKSKKVPTISIVNTEGSSLYRECNENLLIRAGIEIGVASTKAFTQMVLTGRLLASGMKGELNDEAFRVKMSARFSLLAERMDHLINKAEEIKKIAEEISVNSGFFFTGRGIYYPIALEGALKLKEIAYVHAEGYASGELKHGPIALIDDKMVNIAIVGPELYDKTVSNIQEIKARKGVIVSLGPVGDVNLKEISDYYIEIDFDGLGELSPLLVNVANQLLAYYVARAKGTDIDQPRNLAKSVTVE